MKAYKIWVILWVYLMIPGVGESNAQQKSQSHENNNFVNIAGLWTATSETALHFDDITIKATINIIKYPREEWKVQGCFMWGKEFRDYWQLSGFQFIDSTGQVNFKDADGSIFKGNFDEEQQRINGMVYSVKGDSLIAEDKLDFIRGEDLSVSRLFHSRKAEVDGSIKYFYKVPDEEKFLPTTSVFRYVKDSVGFFDLMKEVINQKWGRLESFLIVKDGNLIVDEYFYNYSKDDLHNIFSCTKSVVSLLAGMALNDNGELSVDQPLYEIFPGNKYLCKGEKSKITLRHVLTMSAGLKQTDLQKYKSVEALLDSTFAQALESKPGEVFNYHWNSPNILGGLIVSLSGMQVDKYAYEKLFKHLGISNYRWGTDFGVPDCYSNLFLRPRDMTKIGQLVLNRGKWGGQQIVPEDWILQSTAKHIAESKFLNYGFQWWHRSKKNNSWWDESDYVKRNEHEMICAIGFGGQYVFIVPDLDLVVVTTSSDYNEGTGMAFQKFPMMIEKVIPLFE